MLLLVVVLDRIITNEYEEGVRSDSNVILSRADLDEMAHNADDKRRNTPDL